MLKFKMNNSEEGYALNEVKYNMPLVRYDIGGLMIKIIFKLKYYNCSKL